MAKRLRILAVCGFGVGTSLILRMNIENVLKKNGVNAEVTNSDITTASSVPTDMIFTSAELYDQLLEKVNVPLVKINNFMNNSEIEEKGMPVIEELTKNK
ncbi:PTS sugar transporter subunit IIB [Clostridium sediminicola]|uniref:PTS sugar transporter subunit IIB n=1 Tax=Clostridium sediminicola TaxID=3114879 RepID=UPI0031F22DD0